MTTTTTRQTNQTRSESAPLPLVSELRSFTDPAGYFRNRLAAWETRKAAAHRRGDRAAVKIAERMLADYAARLAAVGGR